MYNPSRTVGQRPPKYGLGTESPFSPVNLNQAQTIDVGKVEEAINLMREMRTKIEVPKHIKIMIFKERFVKSAHSYLSSDTLKKLLRYKNSPQPENRELHSSPEPDHGEHESNKPGETITEPTTNNNRINEYNNMEL